MSENRNPQIIPHDETHGDYGRSDKASNEVQPCPCCGYRAAIEQVPHDPEGPNSGGYYIECKRAGCGITTRLAFACKDDPLPGLVESWNRRPVAQSAGVALTSELKCRDGRPLLKELANIVAFLDSEEAHPSARIVEDVSAFLGSLSGKYDRFDAGRQVEEPSEEYVLRLLGRIGHMERQLRDAEAIIRTPRSAMEPISAFIAAAKRFAEAHVNSDALDAQDDVGVEVGAWRYEAADREYNSSKAALVKAFIALPKDASVGPGGDHG